MSGGDTTSGPLVTGPLVTVHLSVRGPVPADAVAYAQERLCALARRVSGRVLTALVVLDVIEVASSAGPVEESMLVEASFDVDGSVVRGHAVGCRPREAVDDLVGELDGRLARLDGRVTAYVSPA